VSSGIVARRAVLCAGPIGPSGSRVKSLPVPSLAILDGIDVRRDLVLGAGKGGYSGEPSGRAAAIGTSRQSQSG
jgi:hypothetical protein